MSTNSEKPRRYYGFFCNDCGREHLIYLKGRLPVLIPISTGSNPDSRSPDLRLLVGIRCPCGVRWFGTKNFRTERGVQKYLHNAQADYAKLQLASRRKLRFEKRRLAKQLEKVTKELEACKK